MTEWYNTETHETRRAQFKPSGFGWMLKSQHINHIEENDDDGIDDALTGLAVGLGVSALESLLDNDEADSGLIVGGGSFGGGGSSGDW